MKPSSIDFSRRSLIAPKSSILPRISGSSTSRRNENRIIINVGGVRYETYRSTLKNIPDTRLSWLTNTRGHNPDYDPESGEFFFDRHPGVFNMILNYYRTGKLHAPTDVCGPLFEEELAFWGLDEKQIEPCCWNNYRAHRDAQETLAEMDGADANSDAGSDGDSDHLEDIREKFGIIEEHTSEDKSWWRKNRPRIWKLLDEPRSSTSAKVFAFLSLAFVLTFIISFCMESHILFRESLKAGLNLSTISVREKEIYSKPMLFLDVVEYMCVLFFTFELILRLCFCPSLRDYVRKVFNWIDVFVVLPCYLCIILLAVDPDIRRADGFRFLNALRLFRIFRILKLTVHVDGLKILGHTIKASAKELMLLFLALIIGVLIFACLIYYAEQVDEAEINSFSNIPQGFWWAVVTMTTLGYGDLYPRTALGYIIGTVCAVCGLLMLSLPVPVIVSHFTLYYTHAQARLKLPRKAKRQALINAANALVDQESVNSSMDVSGTPNHVTGSKHSLDRTSSDDSAIGSSYEKVKSASAAENHCRGKDAGAGISVVFTDETPCGSRAGSLESDGDDEDDPTSSPTFPVKSSSSLSPVHSIDQPMLPHRQRRVSSFTISPRASISSRRGSMMPNINL